MAYGSKSRPDIRGRELLTPSFCAIARRDAAIDIALFFLPLFDVITLLFKRQLSDPQ